MQVAEQIDGRNDAMTVIINAEYITPAELAKGLNKSVRTLDRWHALRIGPPRTVVCRTILYRRESVLEWLRAQEDGAHNRKRRNRRAA